MSVAMRFTIGDLRRLLAAADDLDRLKAEAQQFSASLNEQTGAVDFLEVIGGDAFDVAPEAALAYFKNKGLRPTFSYRDMIGEAHDHAFTVAKMMDVDMLGQVKASLESALANGTSFNDWKNGIEPILQAGGWWGTRPLPDPVTGAINRVQLGSPWRLETIFRTNMQQAYAVQAWQEIESQKDIAPFLMYDAVDDFRTRPEHRGWDRTVLPVDHPWFETHYPPLGFNCRCGVIQLSAEEIDLMGLSQTPAPEDGTYRWRNPRTEIAQRVPVGVDPGFDRNPGKTMLADLRRMASEKIAQLGDGASESAEAGMRSVQMQSAAGKASVIVVDLAGDVQTAAKINSLIQGPVIGYIEARLIGATPTIEQQAAFDALTRAERIDIERRITLGA